LSVVRLTLDQQKEVIASYQSGLADEIDAGGLYARNPTAHKWKVTYRTIILRELVAWRFCDIMNQVLLLESNEHFLGSRLLLRSAIETLSLLIYSSEKMECIVGTGDGFHEYSKKSTRLLLGTKLANTKFQAINIIEVLEKASKEHPELKIAYDDLSETAHPNFDGLFRTYGSPSDSGMLTTFSNQSSHLYSSQQAALISLLLVAFETEYNFRWDKAFNNFENWIEKNDRKLEDTQ